MPSIRSIQIGAGNSAAGAFTDLPPVQPNTVELVKGWTVSVEGSGPQLVSMYCRLAGGGLGWVDSVTAEPSEPLFKECWHVLEHGDILGVTCASAGFTYLISGARLLA
jgi:hypothetical protein